jgi:hypothetical protein
MALTLYVDDLILGSDSIGRQEWLITKLTEELSTKVISLPTNVLRLSIKLETIPCSLNHKPVKILNYK